MNDPSEKKATAPEAVESQEASPSRPKRGGRDALWFVLCVCFGLFGALVTRALWPARQLEVPPTPDKPEQHATTPSPGPAAAAEEPAERESIPQTPLPTSAGPLMEEAGEVVARLTRAFPDDLDALEMKARFQKWTGKTEEAVATWQECLKLNPHYAHAYLGMAEAAAKKGEHEKAAELARQALQYAPGLFMARAVLAEALVNLGRPQEAIDSLETSLQTDPRSYGYFLLGRAYTLTGQLDKAKENYEAAIRKYPDYAEAYYGLARILVRLGQADAGKEAMVTYRRLMSVRNPGRQGMDMIPETFETLCTNTAILYTDTGRIYHGHHRLPEAERLWRRAAALSPENLECRRALAWLCRSQGKTDEAIQWLEEIARLEPGNPTCWLEIGKLRLEQTQLRPAEEAYQKACEAAPKDARGFAALATLYLRSGQQSSEALKLARTAVELAPTAEHYLLLAGASQRNGDSAGEEDARRRAAELARAESPKP